MQGCFNTRNSPFHQDGFPQVVLAHTSSCRGEDTYFCCKGIPWSLFLLLPCFSCSVSLQEEILQPARSSFWWWWYLILDWNQAVLNSALFWPNSPTTFPCNGSGVKLRCRIHSGEHWEEAPASPSDIQQVTAMFQISQGLPLPIFLPSTALSCSPEDL